MGWRMLGLEVRRLKLIAVIYLALLTAGQLALHHHSFGADEATTALVCGVCTFSADGIVTATPPAVPLVVPAHFLPIVERSDASSVPLTETTRGPPHS